jgi:hypothetical protein
MLLPGRRRSLPYRRWRLRNEWLTVPLIDGINGGATGGDPIGWTVCQAEAWGKALHRAVEGHRDR